jgi:membrane associated rhomboid family serine protease
MPRGVLKTMLCPTCRKLISNDEAQCPYCGTLNPGSWIHNNIATRLLNDPERFIKGVIAVNVGMFVLAILLSFQGLNLSMNPLTFLSPDGRVLLVLGATGSVPINDMNRWWTLLSANYLHGGILHILFNMMALRQISGLIIREYGLNRMFCIYTLGGVLGFWISYLAQTQFTIGSSAALCSLIGAALYYGKTRGGVYGQAIYRQVGGWVLILFLFGFMFPGIDNWGHAGGIAAGILLGLLFGYHERKKETRLHQILARLCILVTVGVLIWAIGSGIYYLMIAGK